MRPAITVMVHMTDCAGKIRARSSGPVRWIELGSDAGVFLDRAAAEALIRQIRVLFPQAQADAAERVAA